jgi:adenine-specific DNA methylase
VPRSLIEQWFPAAIVGAESLRERGSSRAYPVVNLLHVWWARRPLTASRAAIVASLLPAWPDDIEVARDDHAALIRKALEAEFPGGESDYRGWFLQALGIFGDPTVGRRAIQAALAAGTTTKGNAYGYDRAFQVSPDRQTIDRVHRLARLRGSVAEVPRVLDPFAGGGSIPFEAVRFGCDALANELNAVAAAILHGTVSLPAQLGRGFAKVIERFGSDWARRVEKRLAPFFPHESPDERLAYIWAHTVPCPSTGRPTPLVPDFWLARAGTRQMVAVRLVPDNATGEIVREIVSGRSAAEYGNRSTYGRGAATSIWTDEPFGADYIREQAQGGRIGEMMLAVSVTRPGKPGREFRAPSALDLVAVEAACAEVARHMPEWEISGVVPTEPIDSVSNYDRGHRMYGINRWSDLFTQRQLLSLVTALQELDATVVEAGNELSELEARALRLYLAFAFDKAADYNSRQVGWDSTRMKLAHTFTKHNFSFQWSFAEFDAASALIPWVVNNASVNQARLFDLIASDATLFAEGGQSAAQVMLGSATSLDIASTSVDAVVTDPPYYDNVMYGECSDFFYVWLKRSLDGAWPELTRSSLSDKGAEAVANKALFRDVASSERGRRGQGKSAAELADEHYEALLTQSFKEANRVLKDDGVLTVMFTHKRVDAWDTLGQALLEAGFSINSSWPVHTESEHSLHQAKKNAASSTILLGCRKRASTEPAYWSDIRREVEEVAEEAAKRFSAEGIKGVDLTLATYGPALSVLSRNWPVYTGNLTPDGEREKLRPDAALDLARHRVAMLKKRELLSGRDVEFDRATDWWLLAWNDFQAAQFPAGEALKLCIAMDLDLDDVAKQHKLVKAASGDVTLLTPAQRRTAKCLDPDAVAWATLIDALHALMLTHDEEGLSASRAWLTRTGKVDDDRFGALVEAAVHAVPRTRDKDGNFTRPEARVLESLRATVFDWIEAPTEPELSEVLTLDFDAG